MDNTRIFKTSFSSVYPLYVQKAERKGRTKEEVDIVICWLTGYDRQSLQQQIESNIDFETFFARGATNKSQCFENYRHDLRLSCRRNRRQTHAADPLSG